MTLPDAIQDALPPDDNIRIGIVLTRFPTTVDIEGNPTPVGFLAPYTPVVGDNVAVVRQDSTWLGLGRTTDPNSGNFPQFQAGASDVTVAAATTATLAVTFATPFRDVPSVSTNINSGVAATAGWGSRAITVTATGFVIFIFGAAASFTASIQWQAQEMTQ